MIEIPSLRPETRYGIPTSDLLLFNRQYVVGYSYLFRQPRWAMQVIDESTMQLEDDLTGLIISARTCASKRNFARRWTTIKNPDLTGGI